MRSAEVVDEDGHLLLGQQVLSLREVEAEYLRWAALRFDGDRRTLADRLGISERTLYRKLRELEA